METQNTNFTRALKWLSIASGALVLASSVNVAIGRPFWGITKFIHMGYDNNATAWFSSMLLFVAAFLGWWVFRSIPPKHPGRGTIGAFAWLLLFMSCDEIAAFHEYFGAKAAGYLGLADADFAKHTSWVYVGGVVVIAVFAVFCWKLRGLGRHGYKGVNLIVLGLVAIVLGGVGLEVTINWLNHYELQWVWNIEIITEEALELLGTLLICFGLNAMLPQAKNPTGISTEAS